MVHNFLIRNFPGCELKYEGVEGLDHQITFNEHTVWIETKTCKRIVRTGVSFHPERPVLFEKVRLGRFKFDQRQVYPYKQSQHKDLVEQKGWYIFVVGPYIITGAPAEDIDVLFNDQESVKWLVWPVVLNSCYPDWLQKLKMQVYGVKNEK